MKRILVAGLFVHASAQAAPCNRPDQIDAVPPDGAVGVPTNASLQGIYRTNAEYLGEEIVLERVSTGEIEPVVPTWVAEEGVLSAAPSTPLVPGELYGVEWPKLRGISTATLGQAKSVTFEAGAIEDSELPLFQGVSSVEWDVVRETDPCTDSQEERYVFDIGFSEASDDGGRDSLSVLVFETRGDVNPAAPKPVAVRRLPAPGKTLRITEPIDGAIGRVCFAALVRDSTGKASGGANREVCVETVEPPFFYGCSISRRFGAPWLVAVGIALFAFRSRSRRCARKSG